MDNVWSCAWSKVRLSDWARYASGEGFTYEDGIHLTEPGRAQIAALVARAVGPAPQPLPPPAPTGAFRPPAARPPAPADPCSPNIENDR